MKTLSVLILITLSATSVAEQRLDMQGTSIIGNKELPNVLYIVPWKSADRVVLDTPPIDSVLDDPIQPLKRSTFKRQLNYYDEIYSAKKP
ncbi:MAG: hypothetical protein ISR73_10340 [Gammaproteobacteria bacterium]|nr:hypothetical protein [Gammaproteobacteria bacterium]